MPPIPLAPYTRNTNRIFVGGLSVRFAGRRPIREFETGACRSDGLPFRSTGKPDVEQVLSVAGNAAMRSFTEYLTFNIPSKMAFVNLTPQVEAAVRKSGVVEGIVLCNAMHITASVFINDDETPHLWNTQCHRRTAATG